MIPDFQTIAAWAVVVLTVALFLKRRFKKGKQGCGGCGCSPASLLTSSVPKKSDEVRRK